MNMECKIFDAKGGLLNSYSVLMHGTVTFSVALFIFMFSYLLKKQLSP